MSDLLPYLRQLFHEGRCPPEQRRELVALGLATKFPHNSKRDGKPLWFLTKSGGALLRQLDSSYATAETETMTMTEFEKRFQIKKGGKS